MLRAFDHICMEKARYKFIIVIIIIIIIIIIIALMNHTMPVVQWEIKWNCAING